jgi:glycolate oxidase FAD binding subunit
MTVLRPETPEDVAQLLRERSDKGEPVLVRGGGSKAGWGTPVEIEDTLSLSAISGVVEHSTGDMTAILRAGTPMVEAAKVFADADQMLAVDPWYGHDGEATIGGVVSTGDSGPLRHRYAATRDLVLGIQMATSDGTLARAGSRVIKNVAGYDLAKLFTGAHGTLGVITEVIVRLHPKPRERVTVSGRTDDAQSLKRALQAVASEPLELECLDVSWHGGGEVLARVAGAAIQERVDRIDRLLKEHGLQTKQSTEDDEIWERQRRSQRSDEGVIVRVSGRLSEIARMVSAISSIKSRLIGRGAYGVYWVSIPAGDGDSTVAAVEELRSRLQPYVCAVTDAPEEVRCRLDVWNSERVPGLEVMRSVKARFDPSGTCNPGTFVGGI